MALHYSGTLRADSQSEFAIMTIEVIIPQLLSYINLRKTIMKPAGLYASIDFNSTLYNAQYSLFHVCSKDWARQM